MGIYGHPSAKKLSDLNHEFHSWKQAYRDGMSSKGYHDKRKTVVNFDAFPEDIKAVGDSDPPFPKRTFVKLDSLRRTHISNLSNVSMARGGKTLDAAELSEIISAIIRQ